MVVLQGSYSELGVNRSRTEILKVCLCLTLTVVLLLSRAQRTYCLQFTYLKICFHELFERYFSFMKGTRCYRKNLRRDKLSQKH